MEQKEFNSGYDASSTQKDRKLSTIRISIKYIFIYFIILWLNYILSDTRIVCIIQNYIN